MVSISQIFESSNCNNLNCLGKIQKCGLVGGGVLLGVGFEVSKDHTIQS